MLSVSSNSELGQPRLLRFAKDNKAIWWMSGWLNCYFSDSCILVHKYLKIFGITGYECNALRRKVFTGVLCH
jgi:hypothetical protein